MIRATTPTHTFSFENIDPSTFKILNIYYAQQGVQLLLKTKEDCEFSTKETEDGIIYLASTTLTKEETKLFKSKHDVAVQLRALTADDRALASKEYQLPVFNVINDEVLE